MGGDKFTRMSSRDIKPANAGDAAAEPIAAPASSAPAQAAEQPSAAAVSTDAAPAEATVVPAGATSSIKARFEKRSDTAEAADPSAKSQRKVSISTAALKCTQCGKTIYPNDPQLVLGLLMFALC